MSPVWIPETLEDAIHAVVHDSGIPPKAIASEANIRLGYLLDAANPHRADTHFQSRFIAPVTRVTGNDAIVRFLAHAVGGVFVRLQIDSVADVDLAQAIEEFGNYLRVQADNKADGITTPEELDRLERQANALSAAVYAHVAKERANALRVVEIGRRA